MDICQKDLPHVICFILHNFCEDQHEITVEGTVQMAMQRQSQPSILRNGNCGTETEAKRIRDTYKMYFSNH